MCQKCFRTLFSCFRTSFHILERPILIQNTLKNVNFQKLFRHNMYLHSNDLLNPIPTGHGRNQPIYECHVTTAGRNRVNENDIYIFAKLKKQHMYITGFCKCHSDRYNTTQSLTFFLYIRVKSCPRNVHLPFTYMPHIFSFDHMYVTYQLPSLFSPPIFAKTWLYVQVAKVYQTLWR